MKKIPKEEARKRINEFFSMEKFTSEEVRKIKRLAMKHNVKLKTHKKLFCKKCLSKLKGRVRVNNSHKMVVCSMCGFVNRQRI